MQLIGDSNLPWCSRRYLFTRDETIIEPSMNSGSVDGMAVGLGILAIAPLVSLYTLDVGRLYPSYLIWGRALVRLALAGILYYLRPRERDWKPAGNF